MTRLLPYMMMISVGLYELILPNTKNILFILKIYPLTLPITNTHDQISSRFQASFFRSFCRYGVATTHIPTIENIKFQVSGLDGDVLALNLSEASSLGGPNCLVAMAIAKYVNNSAAYSGIARLGPRNNSGGVSMLKLLVLFKTLSPHSSK